MGLYKQHVLPQSQRHASHAMLFISRGWLWLAGKVLLEYATTLVACLQDYLTKPKTLSNHPAALMSLSRVCDWQELAEEYGRHRATEFNVGAGAARRGTGVRYEDVAGIDHVKADIEAMMDAVLGKGGYSDMGVKPPRVRAAAAGSPRIRA